MAVRASKSQSKRVPDAVALLKADHRQVADWFEQFEATKSAKKKQKLATSICNALTVHTQIEEEIFYPAFLRATKDKDMRHEAIVEHDGAKNLIAQIRFSVADSSRRLASAHPLLAIESGAPTQSYGTASQVVGF
jgi:hemerythrin superfamily protein